MSGYTPVFDSVFQGSLCGKYPDLPVWLVLLALQQRGGVIDAHPSYIATVSGIPQADIESAIARFCEPDPSSRTPEHDGRRLEPLEGRGFGWRVLNYEKYRNKARKQDYDAARTASGADAERKREARQDTPKSEASRQVPTSPDKSRSVPPSEAEAEAIERGSANGRKRPSRRCPPSFEPDREWAKREIPDLDVDQEIQKFRDCEFKNPRSDWAAAWRNWIRACRENGRYAKAGGGIKWV